MHPEAGLPVYSMIGPFGPYVQLGEAGEDGKKPKRMTIPKTIDPQHITLETALGLLSLPRTLGSHPETGKPVKASIGRFGPYVVHEDTAKVYKSLPREMDVLQVDLPAALELLKQARARRGATPLRELGAHPADGQPVQLFEGKYGPYVKHGKVNATVPKETPIDQVTLAQAVALIEERAARGGVAPRRAARRSAPKKAAKKAPPKNNAGRKPATSKAPLKKAPKKKPPPKKK
jgi:DNA topoisomerase-1